MLSWSSNIFGNRVFGYNLRVALLESGVWFVTVQNQLGLSSELLEHDPVVPTSRSAARARCALGSDISRYKVIVMMVLLRRSQRVLGRK